MKRLLAVCALFSGLWFTGAAQAQQCEGRFSHQYTCNGSIYSNCVCDSCGVDYMNVQEGAYFYNVTWCRSYRIEICTMDGYYWRYQCDTGEGCQCRNGMPPSPDQGGSEPGDMPAYNDGSSDVYALEEGWGYTVWSDGSVTYYD